MAAQAAAHVWFEATSRAFRCVTDTGILLAAAGSDEKSRGPVKAALSLDHSIMRWHTTQYLHTRLRECLLYNCPRSRQYFSRCRNVKFEAYDRVIDLWFRDERSSQVRSSNVSLHSQVQVHQHGSG